MKNYKCKKEPIKEKKDKHGVPIADKGKAVKHLTTYDEKHNYFLKLNIFRNGAVSLDGWPNPQQKLW